MLPDRIALEPASEGKRLLRRTGRYIPRFTVIETTESCTRDLTVPLATFLAVLVLPVVVYSGTSAVLAVAAPVLAAAAAGRPAVFRAIRHRRVRAR